MRMHKSAITFAAALAMLSTPLGVAPAVAAEPPSSSSASGVTAEPAPAPVPVPVPVPTVEETAPSSPEESPELAAPEDTTTPEPSAPDTSAPTVVSSPETESTESATPTVRTNRLSAGTASGYFTSPSDGQALAAGQAVTFTVSSSGSWYAYLYCDGDYLDQVGTSYPTATLPNYSHAVDCSAELYVYDEYGYDTYADTVSFTVQPDQVANEIRNLTVNHTTFYPRARDRYRDSVQFALGTRRDAKVVMTVRNSDGRTVRTTTVQQPQSWANYFQRNWFTWNGRNGAGNTVPVGRYRVTFRSEGANLSTASAHMTVTVATGFRTVRRTVSKDGWWGSVDRTSSSCYASETFYPHGNMLDCWGGAFAQATYNFRVPANATIMNWWARGERLCCDDGRVIKTGDRVTSTRYQVRVRVTNWAAYTVTRAGIEYRFRKRI